MEENITEQNLNLQKKEMINQINSKCYLLNVLKDSKLSLKKIRLHYLKKGILYSAIAIIVSAFLAYLFNFGFPVTIQNNIDLIILELFSNSMVCLFTWTAYTRDTEEIKDVRKSYTQDDLVQEIKELCQNKLQLEKKLAHIEAIKKEQNSSANLLNSSFENRQCSEQLNRVELEKRLIFTLHTILKKP